MNFTAKSIFLQKALFVAMVTTVCNFGARAQTVEADAIKLIRAPAAITVLGNDLFGDQTNLYSGGLEFVQSDVTLPGNNRLPVQVARRLTAGGMGNLGHGLFAHWDLDIPSIGGTFSSLHGWRSADAAGLPNTTARCSNFGAPPHVYHINGQYKYRYGEYWHGNMLYIPGSGSEEILLRDQSATSANTNVPADGLATPLTTKGLWAIRCLPQLASNFAGTPANEAGEGFLAISPDGTRYRFDWLAAE